MILARERVAKAREIGIENFQSAAPVLPQSSFAADQMQRRALFRSRFGEHERARGKIQRSEAQLPRERRTRRLPVQTAGNHEVNDQIKIVFERDDDALAETLQADDPFAKSFGYRRLDRAQEKRARKTYAVQRLAENALL